MIQNRKNASATPNINISDLRSVPNFNTSKKNIVFPKTPQKNGKNVVKTSNKEERFRKIYNENFKTLKNYLYYTYGDHEKAKDIMQESFMQLWDNFDNVPCNKAKGYVFVVAKNKYLNNIKRQNLKRKHVNGFQKNLLTYQSPEYILEEKQFLDKINREISALPEKQRTVFLLNRIDGKTYNEIAEMLELSLKTVEVRMHKALVTIRIKIGNV